MKKENLVTLEADEGSLVLSPKYSKQLCKELFDDWLEETFEEKRTGVKAFIEDCCSRGKCVDPTNYGFELSSQKMLDIDYVFSNFCSDKTAARKIKKLLK